MLAFQSDVTLKELIEGMEVPVFVVDVEEGPSFRYLASNSCHEEMTGLKDAILAERRPHEVVPPETANAVQNRYAECVSKGERIQYVQHDQLPSGWRWWCTSLPPVIDDSGRIERIIGTSSDISKRKAAEAALEASERRFRDLIEGSLQGLCIHRGYKPLFVSDAFARIYGFNSTEEVLEMSDILCLMPEQDKEIAWQRWLYSLENRNHDFTTQTRNLTSQGSNIWVEIMGRAVEWMGEPAQQLTVLDITDHKHFEQELLYSRDTLESQKKTWNVYSVQRLMAAS